MPDVPTWDGGPKISKFQGGSLAQGEPIGGAKPRVPLVSEQAAKMSHVIEADIIRMSTDMI